MTILASPPESPESDAAQLLFREARQRRRRRWLVAGLSLVVVPGAILGIAIVGFGGPAQTTSAIRSGRGSQPSAPPIVGHSSTVPQVALGTGATSIYFASAERGWIATGCNQYCLESSPALVTTEDGGRSWRQLATPAIGSVPSSGVIWFYLGGKVEVRFLNRQRGWYLQSGQLWTTGDGGSTWHLTMTTGLVTDLTTAGDSAWILVTHCPSPVQLSCANLELSRWTPTDPTWTPVTKTFSSGHASPTDISLTPAGSSVYIAARGGEYRVAADGTVTSVNNGCRPIRGFPAGQLVGICHVGDDASLAQFAVSANHGQHWTPTVGGPPHSPGRLDWSGASLTNGTGTIWYVVGGATLWRTTASGKAWVRVYQTPAGSTDELYPLLFASQSTGYMGESGSTGSRLLKTTDGGLTWKTVPVP